MSNKIYLGNRLSDLDIGEPSMPISKVILNVDSEKYYQAGDDSGLTIEQDCPWATQAMADSILEKLQGFVYNPYSGSEALLDPAAELGDAITVGGLYGILSTIGRNLDRQGAATIGAPKVDEIEDEYPYKTKERKKTDRTLANVRSLISKTAEEIRLEVFGEDGALTQLSQTVAGFDARIESAEGAAAEASLRLDGFTVTTYDEEGNIKSVKLADGVVTADAIAAGAITADKLTLTGMITFEDLDDETQGKINDAGGISEDEAKTLITRTLVSSPTIKGAEYYDLDELGKLTLGVNSDYGDVPWLKFEDVENEVTLFEVVPTVRGGRHPTILLGGQVLCYTDRYGDIYFGNKVKTTAVFA